MNNPDAGAPARPQEAAASPAAEAADHPERPVVSPDPRIPAATAGRPGAGTVVAASVRGLRVELAADRDVVSDVSFDIGAGEIVGLVGESGSGKTTVGMALLGFARRGAVIAAGSAVLAGTGSSGTTDILALPEKRRRTLRGRVVAYIPQDPAASLNPSLKIERQLSEVIRAHEGNGAGRQAAGERIRAVLAEVGLKPELTLGRYPHQLSGGQMQRVCIAMALILRPRVLVLDEPTTGLDVSTQAVILKLLRGLCTSHQIGALYVTHDLSVLAEIADRVLVMYAGRVVEDGGTSQVFGRAKHPYSRALLGSVPDVRHRTELSVIPGRTAPPGQRPSGCAFHPRCPLAEDRCKTKEPGTTDFDGHLVRCHRAAQVAGQADRVILPTPVPASGRTAVLSVRGLSAGYGQHAVLRDISLEVFEGECLAIVGESGSGKTTLSRCLIGLHAQQDGEVSYRGASLAAEARQRSAAHRQRLQYIFQSPFNSLNPRKSVSAILTTAYRTFFREGKETEQAAVADALAAVGLSARLGSALPDELSGGERQRVSIARALVCQPDILLCDEVTSALDVSVQASILRLLGGLREERGLSMVFVTHNLAVVRNIADRVLVLAGGRVVETAPAAEILDNPRSHYTKTLISNTPSLDVTV